MQVLRPLFSILALSEEREGYSKIAELEQVIGQKQILLEFQEKMMELASKEVGFDLKKKYGSKASSTSGKTDKS